MYAIVQVGGRQYRCAPGGRLLVDRIPVDSGAAVELDDVRMVVAEDGDAGATEVGRPRLEGVRVSATAVSHLRGEKIVVFKYKPKKRYRRKRGFRAELTELRVERVLLAGESAPEASAKAASEGKPDPVRRRSRTAPAPGEARGPAPAKPGRARSAEAGPAPDGEPAVSAEPEPGLEPQLAPAGDGPGGTRPAAAGRATKAAPVPSAAASPDLKAEQSPAPKPRRARRSPAPKPAGTDPGDQDGA